VIEKMELIHSFFSFVGSVLYLVFFGTFSIEVCDELILKTHLKNNQAVNFTSKPIPLLDPYSEKCSLILSVFCNLTLS